jgi:hypothetical protein
VNPGVGTAGKGVRDLTERRYASLPILCVCIVILIVLVIASFQPGASIGYLLLVGILAAVIKKIGRRVDKSVKVERRAVRGAKGEELICKILSELEEDDFLISMIWLAQFGIAFQETKYTSLSKLESLDVTSNP